MAPKVKVKTRNAKAKKMILVSFVINRKIIKQFFDLETAKSEIKNPEIKNDDGSSLVSPVKHPLRRTLQLWGSLFIFFHAICRHYLFATPGRDAMLASPDYTTHG